MKISTFGFLTRRGVRNLGKHWAMTIACIASNLNIPLWKIKLYFFTDI